MQNARERVRFIARKTTAALLEDEVEDIIAKLWRAGRGKLFTIDSTSTRKWAWARLVAMPEFTRTIGQTIHMPMVAEFERSSDWFATSLTTVNETVTVNGETWTVTNPGNLPARLMTIRLRANAAGAGSFTNPRITNNTNGYALETARDAASINDEVKYDTERMTVEYSTNDGSSYINDWANYAIPTGQLPLTMRLEPGANSIIFNGAGTVNLDVLFSFYAPWSA